MEIKQIINGLVESNPKLNWLSEILTQPKLLTQWIEERHPQLSKQVLSYASNVIDPFVAGMGLEISEITDTTAIVKLPYRWKNRTFTGEIPLSVISVAAEFCLRLFWERQLDPMRAVISFTGMESHLVTSVEGTVVAQYEIDPVERERLLMDLNSKGHMRTTLDVPLFNQQGQRLGLVEFRIEMSSDKALSGKS